jgi:hypothetical protein
MNKTRAFFVAVLCFATTAFAQVTGTGTTNFVPLWTAATTIGNSGIYQTAGKIGVGTKTPAAKLHVLGSSGTLPVIFGNNVATSGAAFGVQGWSASSAGAGVFGNNTSSVCCFAAGVFGQSVGGTGVLGQATAATGLNFGVQGTTSSTQGVGVQGNSPNVAVAAFNQVCTTSCNPVSGVAGQFVTGVGGLVLQGLAGSSMNSLVQVFSVDSNGNLTVTGNLSKGSGSFRIDHPLDPANKYLSHSFVESPDMMNIYNGVVVLDSDGNATVAMPDYFQALNSDFRYQLTPIGAPGPNLYVAEEISANHFKIAGGKPGAKVSWQVTGVRQDAYAQAHRIKVEEEKPAQEKGHYLHPELFGGGEKDAVGAALVPAAAAVVAEANENQQR